MQGQRVHVVGVEEGWGRELPGLVAQEVGRGEQSDGEGRGEKMKIAWRYEGLGEFGEGRARGGFEVSCVYTKNLHISEFSSYWMRFLC